MEVSEDDFTLSEGVEKEKDSDSTGEETVHDLIKRISNDMAWLKKAVDGNHECIS